MVIEQLEVQQEDPMVAMPTAHNDDFFNEDAAHGHVLNEETSDGRRAHMADVSQAEDGVGHVGVSGREHLDGGGGSDNAAVDLEAMGAFGGEGDSMEGGSMINELHGGSSVKHEEL